MTCILLFAHTATAQPAASETAERVLPLEITVNGVAGGIWPVVIRGGVVYVPAEAFPVWRIQVRPDSASIDYRGLRYYAVSAIPGADGRIDSEKNQLAITVAADSFVATKLSRELAQTPPRTPGVPALYLNYDLNFNASTGSTSVRELGLLGEVGFSGSLGVLTQTFIGRRQSNSDEPAFVRLESTLRRDFPEAGYTLSLGDAVLRTGLLGRSAYYGGVQFGTNFSLAPHLNRQPVPLITGETAAPSMVQLYVNNVLRQTSNIPAGPFALDNLPALMGNGQVTVVVRDVLGRETLLTHPFLVAAELLAPGLNDWTFDAGWLRRRLGIESARYGEGFVAGMWRRGLSTTWTLEGRAEALRDRQTAGVATVNAFGANLLARAGLLASRDAVLGDGHRWMLGLERPGYRFNGSFTLEGASRSFRSLGEDALTVPARLQLAAQASLIGDWGRLGLGLAHQRLYTSAPVTTFSLNYTTTPVTGWQLSAYVTRAISIRSATTVGALLTVPLDQRTSMAASVQTGGGRVDAYTTVSHAPQGEYGLAWRALAAHQGAARAEAGAYYISPHGQVTADISASSLQRSIRLGAVGGVVATAGRMFATPRVDGSAALVHVPGYGNVGVGLGGRVVAHTDAEGYALVPRLAAYQSNPVRLDPNDLPFSAEIDSIEFQAVPGWRSVAAVTFPVRGGRGALLRIELDDGQPAPAGAVVRIAGEDRDFYVARRGEAYVTGLQRSNRLQLRWREGSCDLLVELPPGGPDDIARVGPLRCAGVRR